MLFFDAKLSLRDQRLLLLEPGLVFFLIMLYIWRLRFVHPSWVAGIFCLLILSHYWHNESGADLGFRAENFGACFNLFSPALLFTSLLLLAGGILLATRRPLDLERATIGFISYCLWGLFQQYVLNSFFVNRFLPGASSPSQAAALGAACFACVHAPNWFLMLVAFPAGYCAARAWIRYRNLYFLGLAHGALGSLLYLVIPDSISHHLVIGPGWFGH